jgi:hypothetical protein
VGRRAAADDDDALAGPLGRVVVLRRVQDLALEEVAVRQVRLDGDAAADDADRCGAGERRSCMKARTGAPKMRYLTRIWRSPALVCSVAIQVEEPASQSALMSLWWQRTGRARRSAYDL